jgi:hypothetical protein
VFAAKMKIIIPLVATFLASVSAVQLPLSKFSDKSIWYVHVDFGHQGQSQLLMLDTGSPWTFLVANGTVCYDPIEGGRTRCSSVFGTPYHPDSTLTRYNGSDDQARLSYADLSVVRGTYAFEDLTLNGFSLDQVPFVLATTTVMDSIWPGTGILGLSPDLPDDGEFTVGPEDVSRRITPSSRHDIFLSRPSQNNKNAFAPTAGSPHDGVLTAIFNHTSLEAYFGLALSRTSENSTWGGILAIGEHLDLSLPIVNASEPFVTLPMEPYTTYYGEQIYVSYSANATGLAFGRNFEEDAEGYYFVEGEDTPFTFDSGTEVNFVPYVHAALIAGRFEPPGFQDSGIWFVDCDATPPSDVAIVFNEQDPFYIHPLDMVVHKEARNRTEICLSAFQGDSQTRILGAPFFKNVYVEIYREEFVGEEAATIWLASREHYLS